MAYGLGKKKANTETTYAHRFNAPAVIKVCHLNIYLIIGYIFGHVFYF